MNPWIKHLMTYHRAHPGNTYKQSMKDARASYRKGGSTIMSKQESDRRMRSEQAVKNFEREMRAKFGQ